MNNDPSSRREQVPLPGFAESASADDSLPPVSPSRTGTADRARQDRTEGLRRVRRMSNWTAAALIVGTGAGAVALAHNAVPATTPTAATTSASSGTTGTGTTAVTHGTGGPHVAHTVATTSASGVTTTTTTRVVNGKTVVTHVRHVPAYHDN